MQIDSNDKVYSKHKKMQNQDLGTKDADQAFDDFCKKYLFLKCIFIRSDNLSKDCPYDR